MMLWIPQGVWFANDQSQIQEGAEEDFPSDLEIEVGHLVQCGTSCRT